MGSVVRPVVGDLRLVDPVIARHEQGSGPDDGVVAARHPVLHRRPFVSFTNITVLIVLWWPNLGRRNFVNYHIRFLCEKSMLSISIITLYRAHKNQRLVVDLKKQCT